MSTKDHSNTPRAVRHTPRGVIVIPMATSSPDHGRARRRLRRGAARRGPHVRPVPGPHRHRGDRRERAATDTVDIALYDSFAQPESDHDEIGVLVKSPQARRVVVYTWNFHPDLIASARKQGAHGYLSKTLPARDLVAALEAVHAGELVVSDPPPRAASQRAELAGPARRPDRPRVRDSRADHPGQEQRRGRRAVLPEPEHGQVLHPVDLPQDRRRQPDPGGAVGRRQRVHPGPPPHRPLARRPVITPR